MNVLRWLSVMRLVGEIFDMAGFSADGIYPSYQKPGRLEASIKKENFTKR